MRETYGPDFDDRLIRLVRDNPAIYDVNHEHYRRYQVRVAIWERIAAEMRTSSKFLQTKWKNIRYNYLQELKSLETGLPNSNIRKRRFTEDLSFLQNTAQAYKKMMPNSYNGSDNDSNSYLHGEVQNASTYEIIEIENSDDDAAPLNYGVSDYSLTMGRHELHGHEAFTPTTNNDCYGDDQLLLTDFNIPTKTIKLEEPEPDVTFERKDIKKLTKQNTHTTPENDMNMKHSVMPPPSPLQSTDSADPLSPLIPPIVIMGDDEQDCVSNCEEGVLKPKAMPSSEMSKGIISNATKRKAMPAPFPVLTPINDPIEMYCLSLVDSLRNMPRSERERVKFEFAKILKDAKYKDQS